MAQVTDEYCGFCGAHYEVLDIDMQESDEFGLCKECFDNPKLDYDSETGVWYEKAEQADTQTDTK